MLFAFTLLLAHDFIPHHHDHESATDHSHHHHHPVAFDQGDDFIFVRPGAQEKPILILFAQAPSPMARVVQAENEGFAPLPSLWPHSPPDFSSITFRGPPEA